MTLPSCAKVYVSWDYYSIILPSWGRKIRDVFSLVDDDLQDALVASNSTTWKWHRFLRVDSCPHPDLMSPTTCPSSACSIKHGMGDRLRRGSSGG